MEFLREFKSEAVSRSMEKMRVKDGKEKCVVVIRSVHFFHPFFLGGEFQSDIYNYNQSGLLCLTK